MTKLANTELHTNYSEYDIFNNPNGSPALTYDEARNNYLARKENDILFTGGTTYLGQNITYIHDDSETLPTVGYGINLDALAYEAIEVIFRYAYNDSLTQLQEDGLLILQEWKNNNGSYTNQQIIDIAHLFLIVLAMHSLK